MGLSIPQRTPLILPESVFMSKASMGAALVDAARLGIYPALVGAEKRQGYNAGADLLTQTVDGFDLNSIWDEFQSAISVMNELRSTIVRLLTFPVTNLVDRVPQISQAEFEVASEYGEPRGMRPAGAYFTLGYDFQYYDLASRFTWRFLADAPASQVTAINAMALEADNRLVFSKVMDALYNPTNRLADINGQDVNVYALYNGDGTIPPRYKSNSFDGNHSHYLTSGAATVTSGDLDDMYDHVAHHGYTRENGVQHVLLVNTREAKEIRKFRVATGATWDFIPAQGSPAQFMPVNEQLLGGGQPAATYAGLDVAGSYGNLTVVVDDMFPVGYMALIGTGGPDNLQNPIGFREHQNPSMRGLRLVKGPDPDYPLVDSFYQRGFGTGIRQRGGSVVMQVTASATYTKPSIFAG